MENKVRRFIGTEERDPGFFVLHMVPPYNHEGPPLREYRIPCAKRPDDFLAACWRDVGAHRALYDAVAYYMWEHPVVERDVVLKARGWAGHFVIEENEGVATVMVLEVPL